MSGFLTLEAEQALKTGDRLTIENATAEIIEVDGTISTRVHLFHAKD